MVKINEALACVKENFGAYFLTLVMKFLGNTDSFQEFLFEPDVMNQISPHDWWKAQFNKKDVNNEQQQQQQQKKKKNLRKQYCSFLQQQLPQLQLNMFFQCMA